MKKYAIAAFVLLAITVSALLIFAPLLGRKDATFMRVCWDGEVAMVEESQTDTCMDGPPREITWPKEQLPLKVCSGPEAAALALPAISTINRSLGYEHIRLSKRGDGCDISIATEPISPSPAFAGYCTLLRSEHRMISIIRTNGLAVTPQEQLRVMLHELGHCALGLAHDEEEGSMMFPSATATMIPRLTDQDRDAIILKYREQP